MQLGISKEYLSKEERRKEFGDELDAREVRERQSVEELGEGANEPRERSVARLRERDRGHRRDVRARRLRLDKRPEHVEQRHRQRGHRIGARCAPHRRAPVDVQIHTHAGQQTWGCSTI